MVGYLGKENTSFYEIFINNIKEYNSLGFINSNTSGHCLNEWSMLSMTLMMGHWLVTCLTKTFKLNLKIFILAKKIPSQDPVFFNTWISQYYLVFFKWYTSKAVFCLFVCCFCFCFAFHYLELRLDLIWKYLFSYLNISRFKTSRILNPRKLSRSEKRWTLFSEKCAFKRSKLVRVTIKSIRLLLIRLYDRTFFLLSIWKVLNYPSYL